jgi:DNA-directed RNA polymerase alpha subunit
MAYKQDLTHMPYIKNKECFKAVLFARKLMGTNLDIEHAIYRAARYYKIDTSTVAKYVGKFASNVRDNKTGQDACFTNEQYVIKYCYLDNEDSQEIDSYIEDLVRQKRSTVSIQNSVLEEFSVKVSVSSIRSFENSFKLEMEQKLIIDFLKKNSCTIDDLKMVNTSVKKSLVKYGLTTLSQIWEKSDKDLLQIEKIGKKTLMEIRSGITILAHHAT